MKIIVMVFISALIFSSSDIFAENFIRSINKETLSADCKPSSVIVPLCSKKDSDNDGVLDGYDRCVGHDDFSDADFDGIADGCDACPDFSNRVLSDYFIGNYLMEQLSGQDPFFSSETFGDSQIVSISGTGNVRSFDFLYFPGIFDSNYNFQMTFECGNIIVLGSINSGGLGCGGANIGFSTGIPAATYDERFSDDIIIVNVSDFDPDGNCNTGPNQVVLRFTKQ